MTTTVQVRKKGQFTIPVNIRETLNIADNEAVTVSLLGKDAMIVIPQKLQTQVLLEKTAELARKRGVTLEDMLSELDEIRHQA